MMQNKLLLLIYPLTWVICAMSIYSIHSCEKENSITIELSLSEIGQIKRDRAKEKLPVDEMTIYLAELNDGIYKIVEAWIRSQKTPRADEEESFAYELSLLIEKTFKIYNKDLRESLENSKENVDIIMKKMQVVSIIILRLQEIRSRVYAIWHEESDETNHTEWEPHEVCDSENECHTEWEEKVVCDYITYTYYYNPVDLDRAVQLTEDFLSKNYDIPHYEDLLKEASQTNAEGEYAVEQTVKKEKYDTAVKTYHKNWITKSTFIYMIKPVRANLLGIRPSVDALRVSSATAQTTTYVDHSCGRGDPPYEMDIASSYASLLSKIIAYLDEYWNGLKKTKEILPKLEKDIYDYVNFYENGVKTKDNITSTSILEKVRALQSYNFNQADPITPYRTFLVVSGIVGIVALIIALNVMLTIYIMETKE